MTNQSARRRVVALAALALLIFTGCSGSGEPRNFHRAIGGVLDLRDHSFEGDGPVNLIGEWEFSWASFTSAESPPNRTADGFYVNVPSSWIGVSYDGAPLPGQGYATYRLRVLLPEADSVLALKILDMATACEILVDGDTVYRAGEPGTSRESSAPGYDPAVVELRNTGREVDILVHVSNFDYRRGGMWEPLTLGSHGRLVGLRENRLLRDALFFGAILIMGLYHLTLFSTRPDRKSIFWFGIFCMLIALRMLMTGERYITHLFPNIWWELVPKLEYLSFYLAIPVFLLYLSHTFPEESVRSISIGTTALCLAFAAPVLILPARLFTHTLTAFQITTFVIAAYGFAVMVRAVLHQRIGSKSILIGFFVFFLTIANDILNAAGITQSIQIVSVGLLVFIFAKAMHIARMFNADFVTVKRQSVALQEANAIINTSPAVAFSWKVEPGWPVEFVSENVVHLTGYTAAELTAKDLSYLDLVHPEDLPRVQDEVSAFSEDPEATQATHEPYRLVGKNGEERWVSDKTFIHRDQDGKIISYRGIIEDVTELKRINDELSAHRHHLEDLVSQRTQDLELAKVAAEEASTAKSDFLASMSHELRTPLNHIIGFAGLVAEGRVGSLTPEQDEYLNDALSSARHLLNLINEILDIAKVESGSLDLEIAEFSLAPFLEAIVRLFREEASQQNLTFDWDNSGAPESISADERRLKQILINLLSNAVKFSPDGGVITVHVSVQEAHSEDARPLVLFQVSDQGVGVPETDRERIFESFEQVDSPSRRARPGTGLGLSISKALVSLHGGEIWVESDGPGKGSTFCFTLLR